MPQTVTRAAKRPRRTVASTGANSVLMDLLHDHQWSKVIQQVQANPKVVESCSDPSPLAIACRSGAPLEVIQAILDVAPSKVRHGLDSRGTPLHEAIVCETTSLSVLAALLEADEALGTETKRAALLQDIDGFTPLHLLIRKRFQSHILLHNNNDTEASNKNSNYLMSSLELLVKSCPPAILIPDRGEYEESPIVYALKANMYSPMLGDDTLSRVELQIHDMVACMLKYLPSAAGHVLNGYRGRYTALHSAVFHGRCTKTIELLLLQQGEWPNQSALLANTQGELPLHFCTMRGERPGTVHVLAQAAPEAVFKRDASGLTPFHWLWARYVSTVLACEDNRRDGNEATTLINRDMTIEMSKYTEFWTLEQGDFELDLQLMRRMDPSVDFMRMRYIPAEAHDETMSQQWVEQAASLLHGLRRKSQELGRDAPFVWSRQEVVTSHFWTKNASLLEAAQMEGTPRASHSLTHTAFECPCPPPLARLISLLFPEELSALDEFGRLPIHCAARRQWHAWDLPRTDGLQAANDADSLLHYESLQAIQTALQVSPTNAIRLPDTDNCLVIHYVIDSFVKACSLFTRSTPDTVMSGMLSVLKELVDAYPESLEHRDGVHKLYPFLQATAIATERRDAYRQDELTLSISFELLRWNPSVLARLAL